MRESDNLACGGAPENPPDEPGPAPSAELDPAPVAFVQGALPMSSLGPPMSNPLQPIREDEDLEENVPSEVGDFDHAGLAGFEDVEAPETEKEARMVAQANARWSRAAAALQLQECPTLEIPLLRTLPDKSQQSVARGLAAILRHLRYEGFMVRRLHSDRGREFNNNLAQKLCHQRDVHQTFTQGDDAKQNGRVESFHARLKGQARSLIKAAAASTQDWPFAMRTAQAAMWAKAMHRLGRPSWQPLPFGTRVKVRTRSWERYGDVWADRVQDAVVLAPSVETCKGHVARTHSGTLMHTTAVFRGAVHMPSPAVIPPAQVVPAEPRFAPEPLSQPAGREASVSFPFGQTPPHRVTGKQSVSQLSLSKVHRESSQTVSRHSARVELHALSEAAAALLACRPVPFRTAAALIVSSPDVWNLARSLPKRLSAGPDSMYLLYGWYKHGGLTGVTSATSQLPQVVALLNALLAHAHPTGVWTTSAVFSSAVAAPHTDRRNLRHSCNHILPLALPATEQYMWVTNPLQPALQPMAWLGDDGVARPGFRLPLGVGKPVCVDPHSLHAIPMPLQQDQHASHVLLVGFSVPWLDRATESELHCLQSCGFRLEVSRGGVQQGISSGGAQPGSVQGEHTKGSVQGPGGSSGGAQRGLQSDALHTFSVKKQELTEVPADSRGQSTASAREGFDAGLLEVCLTDEGLGREREDTVCGIQGEMEGSVAPASLEEDVQPDTFAEGSVTSRGAYARRLETRDFEPNDWDRVKQYLEGLGLEHLIQAIDNLGVDSLDSCTGKILWKQGLLRARRKQSSDAPGLSSMVDLKHRL